ncbi:hypothetical protein K504DRAFT_508307 [Pleomassaria siparia CBS 279.74]|uniref:Zn(2)-C6 fungal-type domain-containing protein n=1 Tax=Pleomassaria siparia CBS 279.74 TaxID=1314801 RepID=A0A6G1JRJ6_9PLEO|nr:hypothetical protein K504DRAFT_508307 [Pleomassaria siparia CBS 279.74]
MPANKSRFQHGPGRKRKSHAKSRKGCGNCKLRRVKCDEKRPQCQKCVSYGVSCNYDGKKASLHLSAQGSFQVEFSQNSSTERLVVHMGLPPPVSVSVNRTMVAMANDSLKVASMDMDTNLWTFSERDLGVMKRFQERTAMTIGTAKTAPLYRHAISSLAFQHPFLMHMVLGLTLLHDAHLCTHSPALAATYTHNALQHWNTATKLFNHVLSNPIIPTARDAIWTTGALIGAVVFAYVESPDVSTAWPLKPPDPNDLDWLKLSEGKKAIWKVADPLRPDSIFHNIYQEQGFAAVPTWIEENDLSRIPPDILAIFDIGAQSTLTNNVYHLPVLILARLDDMTPTHEDILNFLYFMGYMTAGFRHLLQSKDPRALLLLAWWFETLKDGDIWWLKKRSKVGGESIKRWFEGRFGIAMVAQLFRRLENGRYHAGRWDAWKNSNDDGDDDDDDDDDDNNNNNNQGPPMLPAPWCGVPAPYEGMGCPVQ